MPWDVRDVVQRRLDFVERAIEGGQSFSALCKEFGISRATGYKWANRYETYGSVLGLENQSRRPRHVPNRTDARIEARIAKLFETYGWGPKKIRKLLANERIHVPLITVRRIYKRLGLSQPTSVIGPAHQRFERERPNELLQMDFKGELMTDSGDWCYPLSIIDDHSRFCLGLFGVGDQSGKTVERCLVKTFENYGVPEGMLMDHGTPWWGSANGWGLTNLSVKLVKQGVTLHFGRVRHPQTQGKVERFHRTLKDELSRHRGKLASVPMVDSILQGFRQIYNEIRPHEACNMEPPVRRYEPSRKQYDPSPPEWEYPPGSEVAKLDDLGRLRVDGRRFFVCEALREELVQLKHLEATTLVVYRHMAVRELDLDTGASTAVAFPMN